MKIIEKMALCTWNWLTIKTYKTKILVKTVFSKVLPARAQETEIIQVKGCPLVPKILKAGIWLRELLRLSRAYSLILLFLTNFSDLTLVHDANWRNFQMAEPRTVVTKLWPNEELFLSLRGGVPDNICSELLRSKDFYMPQEANSSPLYALMLSVKAGKNWALGCKDSR